MFISWSTIPAVVSLAQGQQADDGIGEKILLALGGAALGYLLLRALGGSQARCPSCGAFVAEDSRRCTNCGQRFFR